MNLELFLFTTDPVCAAKSLAAGIDGFVVDWEYRGKNDRQAGLDTEVNTYGAKELAQLSAIKAPRLCRINPFGPTTPAEVEAAVRAGATHILLPMVRSPREVEAFLGYLHGRTGAGVLIETTDACRAARAIARLPLDLVFVGFNDLAIDRQTPTLFEPLVDGLALELRDIFAKCRFGLGGVTTVDKGEPVACLDLMAELARHRCDFTFLRRSFKRDIVGRDMNREVELIRDEWQRLGRRNAEEIAHDHERFVRRVHAVAEAAI